MPKEIILIAAVTVDGFIARHNLEVTSWSLDLSLFKKQTMGYPVIMGANTFKTLSSELYGRENIVLNRKDTSKSVLKKINGHRCFIIGGGATYSLFSSFITHLYVTPHPYVFGEGVRLFEKGTKELKLQFNKLIAVDHQKGIYQYQYKVKDF